MEEVLKMKIGELLSGIKFMVNNEQLEFINKLKEHNILERHALEEREQRLAEQMTSTGLIDRNYNEETQTVQYRLHQR
jgi:hypothetical protein